MTGAVGWLALLPLLACAHPSATDFGRIPAIEAAVLSPNGELVAWVDNSAAIPQIVIIDLEKRSRNRTVAARPGVVLRDLDWADDDTLLIHSSSMVRVTGKRGRMQQVFGTAALQVEGTDVQVLFPGRGNLKWVSGGRVMALHTGRPHKIVISAWSFAPDVAMATSRKNSPWTHNLLEVDTRTGDSRGLHQGTTYTAHWIVDGNGEAVARSEWDVHRRRFTVLHLRDGRWVEIYRKERADSRPKLMGLSADGSAILMTGALDGDLTVSWRLPLDGSAPRKVFEDNPYEIGSVVLDPYSGQPLGEWSAGPHPEIRWYDEKAQARAQALTKTFGGKHAYVAGRSADFSRALVSITNADLPLTYYLVDYKKGTADIVGEHYPALTGVPLGALRPFVYKARDGKEIPAYMTVSPGDEPKKLPLVVLPPSDVLGRDPRQFEWMTQFLATRGYVVLQPEVRGVHGYGDAHAKAGRRQWGRLVQDDITDSVKALIEQGVADPQRVCIVGRSFGGYAALAGAAFTPELYACAVSISGVSDLPDMADYIERNTGPESDHLAYWTDEIGVAEDPQLAATSPARAADSVRSPILLIHGTRDQVIPIAQSKKMASALKARRKPYQFVEVDDDDWLSRSESRIRVLTELERFLATHLGASTPSH